MFPLLEDALRLAGRPLDGGMTLDGNRRELDGFQHGNGAGVDDLRRALRYRCGALGLYELRVLGFDSRILRPQKSVGLYIGRMAGFQFALGNADLRREQPVLEAKPPGYGEHKHQPDSHRVLYEPKAYWGEQRGVLEY
ncbi:MAG: hypothetical protein ACYC46_15945 [Acidobacteriaceae bacterium]